MTLKEAAEKWGVWPYAATLPEGTPARPLQQLDFE